MLNREPRNLLEQRQDPGVMLSIKDEVVSKIKAGRKPPLEDSAKILATILFEGLTDK
jgi:hypothetical protein